MSEHSALLRQLLSSREQWVDIGEGKRVKLRRPMEGELDAMFGDVGGRRALRITLADVQRLAVDWSGISEADLLGKGIGNDDALPFSADVWAVAVGDNLDWLQKCRQAIEASIVARLEQRFAARGNLPATSTPSTAPEVAQTTA